MGFMVNTSYGCANEGNNKVTQKPGSRYTVLFKRPLFYPEKINLNMVNKNLKAPKIFKEGFARFYMKKERFFCNCGRYQLLFLKIFLFWELHWNFQLIG